MTERRILQRVIMPVDRDLDVLKLYVEGSVVHGQGAVDAATASAQELAEKARGSQRRDASLRASAADSAEIVGRRSLVVPPGTRVSLCTYFNAFPASHWRRWSSLEEIALRARLRGEGTLLVYRSTSKGHLQRVESINIDSADADEVAVRLSLRPFIDGGWYWLELVAGAHTLVLEWAEWCADTDVPQGSTTIGITTFNRPDFCVDQLVALGQAGDVLDVIDEILVVDQGTRRVEAHPGAAAARAALGGRLRIIEQANLGGSGGFSRAMEETLRAERSGYVLLLDDDVIAEPESILRAVAFGDLARTPTIVGGHMFDLYDRPVLHAYAERLAPYRWWMEPAPRTRYWHNLARETLRETPWLHHRADPDFNGWWMCLIPVDVLRKIGLSLPVFIKWDDIEYGVRARAAGVPTVALPGAAVWHVPWRDKDNDLDWQSYFQERNRLISAMLHSPYERGGNMLKESFIMVTKHAMAMQYSTAELMLKGIEDCLSGPGHLHATIGTKMAELRAMRAGFVDAELRADPDEFPAVRRRRPPRKGRETPQAPEGRAAVLQAAMRAGLRQLRSVDAFTRRHPQTTVPHLDQRWWLLSRFDSALVSSADGTKVSWYQRDPARFRALMRRNARLHAEVYREWDRLRRQYRTALAEITSPERWRESFEAARPGTGAALSAHAEGNGEVAADRRADAAGGVLPARG